MQNGSGFPDHAIVVSGSEGAVLIDGVEPQPLRCPPLSDATSMECGFGCPICASGLYAFTPPGTAGT